MKGYIHARLGEEERRVLDELKRAGLKESDIVRRGLRLVAEQENRQKSARDLAGKSVGRFSAVLTDLSTNKKYMEGFGE
jgi:Arc/MetJ-type ribon-helix-helix transcriptional regulator